ncbi:MAG: cytochrome c-type biogenesis protein CcmH [Bacteroidota bacterium]|jgi:cytochrome c-type biogenesis protein CcmH
MRVRAALHRLLAAFLLLGMLAAASAVVHAVEPDEVLRNAELEARARRLSAELRCLVCQNQSIDDSNAPLARDLRLLLRERLQAGDSDRAVLDFIVDRYGKFVLLRPPLEMDTLLLWVTPVLVLCAIVIAILLRLRRARSTAATQPARLSPDERARLEDLLKDANR